MKRITREELRDKFIMGAQFTLIETLPKEYWLDSHLPGAIQIDYTEVDEKSNQLPKDKDAEIVVYCASPECPNSTKAAHILEDMGYTNVYDYLEGKQHWVEAGLPVKNPKN